MVSTLRCSHQGQVSIDSVFIIWRSESAYIIQQGNESQHSYVNPGDGATQRRSQGGREGRAPIVALQERQHIMEATMNISRRHLFHTTATLVGTFASAMFVPIAFAQAQSDPSTGSGQVSKQAAQYQDQPNGQQRCSLCANFQAPSACLVVNGVVTPNGWCKLFKAKGS